MAQTFAERVHHTQIGSTGIYTLKTPVDEVVTIKGAFETQPRFADGEELIQEVAVSLLDKGTQHRDRFAIAEMLENRGAQIQFFSDGHRCGFNVRTLRKDAPDVVGILFEQLQEPLFDQQEFEKARLRIQASLQRSLESTGSQANGALSRLLFGPNHPNHTPEVVLQLAQLQQLTIEQIQTYYTTHFGPNRLNMVLVGDVGDNVLEPLIQERVQSWVEHTADTTYDPEAQRKPAQRVDIPIAEKSNLDVRFGHTLGVRRDHPDFVPLYISNYILGGNFSSRLMASIRDEQGLTYGIGSTLAGVTNEFDGQWRTRVTLSQENLSRGIDATRSEIDRYVREGATQTELDEKKMTIQGAFKVGLATTGGLASSLLVNIERGFGVGYLDDFPNLIASTSLEDVQRATADHFHPQDLHIAVAGTLPEEAVI